MKTTRPIPSGLEVNRRPTAPGALVLGSDYRGLGAVQSLGRHGVDVWVLSESERGVANVSRFARRSLRWPPGDGPARIRFLLDLAGRDRLQGWALFPTRDDVAALCARHWDELAEVFRMTTPPWRILRYAHDKRMTNEVARQLGIPVPRTWTTQDVGPPPADIFPAILKPAIKEQDNALTLAKAWPVDAATFHARFAEAIALVPADQVMLQERIQGGGGHQLSFAALVDGGDAICSLVARRMRQFPMDFGRASTFVVTTIDQDVREMATRLLRHLGYTGLVEIEFKRDPATNEPKLLDVNPRLWGWHTLGRRAGMDFAFLAWRLAHRDLPSRREAPPGIRWVWPPGDVPVAVREMRHGRLRFGTYLRSFRSPVDFATWTADDPLPGLLEIPLRTMATFRRSRVDQAAHHPKAGTPSGGTPDQANDPDARNRDGFDDDVELDPPRVEVNPKR
jgi:predicted ATP-grasp superfamily ATP-dependent carboligase